MAKEKKDKKRKSLDGHKKKAVDEEEVTIEEVVMEDGGDNKQEQEEEQVVIIEQEPPVVDKDDEYEVALKASLPFAHPMANKKLNKKILKTIKKASKARHVKRGVKEVVKGLRKNQKGLVIIAGDISPPDVISHIPCLCQDNHIPFIFIPSKESLGIAGATKRPTSCVFIIPGGTKFNKDNPNPNATTASPEYRQPYDEIVKEVVALDDSLV